MLMIFDDLMVCQLHMTWAIYKSLLGFKIFLFSS